MPGLDFLLLIAATAAPPALPPYAEALRCGGLAEAAFDRARQRNGDDAKAYDSAMFWGLAASEAARKAGLPSARFTADQKEAAALAARQLEAREAGAEEALAACLARVPPTTGEMSRGSIRPLRRHCVTRLSGCPPSPRPAPCLAQGGRPKPSPANQVKAQL